MISRMNFSLRAICLKRLDFFPSMQSLSMQYFEVSLKHKNLKFKFEKYCTHKPRIQTSNTETVSSITKTLDIHMYVCTSRKCNLFPHNVSALLLLNNRIA